MKNIPDVKMHSENFPVVISLILFFWKSNQKPDGPGAWSSEHTS